MQDVNYIEEIREERDITSLCISDLLVFVLIMDDGFLERLHYENIVNIMKYLTDVHCLHVTGWVPKTEVYEELSPCTNKLIPYYVQAPILELKLLAQDLKFVFLGPEETFFVVI